MNRIKILLPLLFILLPLLSLSAQEKKGEVTLPLEKYNQLSEAAAKPQKEPRPAPAAYSLSQAGVSVNVTSQKEELSARVLIDLAVKVFENEWSLIPILPAGTAVSSALVNGKSIDLVPGPDGLSWSTNKAGSYQLQLKYDIDVNRSEKGHSLAVPLPQAAAINLKAVLPGDNIDPAVIPSAGTKINPSGSNTMVNATIPSTRGVQITWSRPSKHSHIMSRAHYTGSLSKDTVSFNAEFNVEIFDDKTLTLELLPKSVTLSEITVDGENAPILTENNSFATFVKGKGRHKVSAGFHVPVLRTGGQPSFELQIPRIPVSQIDLKLPGKKELKVTPTSSISYQTSGKETIATLFVPLTNHVAFSWNEAVPEAVKTELRANSSLYHLVHAEEGVLYVKAMLLYEITRGETNLLQIALPKDVQINRVSSSTSKVADWRVTAGEKNQADTLSVFLKQKVKGALQLDISYDRSLTGRKAAKDMQVPLLKALKVQRQRGMAALLAGKELTLKPTAEENITRVGENQLPASIRKTIDKKVAHTYKYVESTPLLQVKAVKPERKQGRFDAIVNTLISLGDVTMKGSSTVEVNVKSGSITDLQLKLPPKVNFLSLTAPSLRTHKANSAQDGQKIDIQFTQEMEGQFRIEVFYELIMGDSQAETKVPTLTVDGAEVEQGRIAVEALSAVEVRASSKKHLSFLEPAELPQQLILKTTNPILLAYKYVSVVPPYELKLKITRHRVIDVKSAAIDTAEYNSLYTKDGLAVTTANFFVRNTRRQFLRIQLPEGSKIWSVHVNEKPEKPALVESKESAKKGPNVLIKIINSARGFPVRLIYQTPVEKTGSFGWIEGTLPRPDITVTSSKWNVYLPEKLGYGRLDSNMKVLVEKGKGLARHIDQRAERSKAISAIKQMEALRLSVPKAGTLFSFEKLYANQTDDESYFKIPYTSEMGIYLIYLLMAAGAVILWLGVYSLASKVKLMPKGAAIIAVVLGLAALLFSFSSYGFNVHNVLMLVVLFSILISLSMFRERNLVQDGTSGKESVTE